MADTTSKNLAIRPNMIFSSASTGQCNRIVQKEQIGYKKQPPPRAALLDVWHPKDPSVVIAKPRPLASIEQRWFVGAHANVGGGYPTDLLAQAPLRWLMSKAESKGLSFRSEVEFDGDALTAPVANSYKAFGYGLYSLIRRPYYRPIGREPDVQEGGSHINVNETIDASVFERWRADPTYRAPNLIEWAKRKQVDPAQLKSSVRADDPHVEVPNL